MHPQKQLTGLFRGKNTWQKQNKQQVLYLNQSSGFSSQLFPFHNALKRIKKFSDYPQLSLTSPQPPNKGCSYPVLAPQMLRAAMQSTVPGERAAEEPAQPARGGRRWKTPLGTCCLFLSALKVKLNILPAHFMVSFPCNLNRRLSQTRSVAVPQQSSCSVPFTASNISAVMPSKCFFSLYVRS